MVREENNLTKYLLGTLGEKEQQVVEQKILLDNDEFEQLLIAEAELTDAYVRRTLASSDRIHFEQRFLLAPEHQQQLNFAQALHRRLDRVAQPSASPQPGWLQWLGNFLNASYPVRGYALGSACALIALGGLWFGYQLVRLQNEVAQIRVESLTPRSSDQELSQQLAASRAGNAQLSQALQNSQTQVAQLENSLAQTQPLTSRVTTPSLTSFASFILTPGALVRGAGGSINQIALPVDVRILKLQLELEQDQYPSYRAVLYTQGGTMLKSWRATPPQQTPDGKQLKLQAPLGLFPAGSYFFQLEGVTSEGRSEKADQFHFRVSRK